MITWFRRLIHPGSYRRHETDTIAHRLREQAQVADLEKHLMQAKRERRERQDLAEALARTPPPWLREDRHP